MQNLYLRIDKGSELTWEELDTNWTRIKNAVDELEQSLEDTRTNKEWILPLYLLGDEDAEDRIWIGESEIYDYELYIYGFIKESTNDIAYIGFLDSIPSIVIGKRDQNQVLFTNYYLDELEVYYQTRIEKNSPFSHSSIYIDYDNVYLMALNNVLIAARSNAGELEVGFFGYYAPQQSIAETSSDPAITELQDILIAYGLALDNRNP